MENLIQATDKYEAAMAMQPEAANGAKDKEDGKRERGRANGEQTNCVLINGEERVRAPNLVEGLKNLVRSGVEIVQFDSAKAFVNRCGKNHKVGKDDITTAKSVDQLPITDQSGDLNNVEEPVDGHFIGGRPISSRVKTMITDVSRRIFLNVKTMRRILAAKETIHKFEVFVPRNDREADSSPEAIRWASGRQLEWIRLQEQGTFERNWDWARLQKAYPQYKKHDVGHVFFVYDHKHSGEHRVRLVFDGSRQNPETYTDTYAPTARGESVRLFHVFAVEEGWTIAQFDVPQAFLKSEIDCVLFVYPPNNFAEFPGQLLKLRLSLYGAKQSAALWNQLIDGFLQRLGFSPSPMDPCLYKRSDALIILFCDDLRVAGLPKIVLEIKAALYKEFQITTSDGI